MKNQGRNDAPLCADTNETEKEIAKCRSPDKLTVDLSSATLSGLPTVTAADTSLVQKYSKFLGFSSNRDVEAFW